tara:strand:+ start:2223 stop:2975 length:753 start_codon:yes stop_codon:yes gene_type:complete
MKLIPAIDIYEGKCVRLFQGNYNKSTTYSDSPVDMALRWVELGADILHIVDLEGARSGKSKILPIIERITSHGIPIQVGGGIRNTADAENAFTAGASKIILGTSAIIDQLWTMELANKFGKDKIIISIDFDKNGLAVTKGWLESSGKKATQILGEMSKLHFDQFILTDTTRDGTLTQPNFDLIKSMRSLTTNKIMIAGGISRVKHLTQLSNLGIDGAIVGTAIYTGDIDFENALRILNKSQTKGNAGGKT